LAASYLLKEDGTKLILEDLSGFIILEDGVPPEEPTNPVELFPVFYFRRRG
jgi:hypothetical protein